MAGKGARGRAAELVELGKTDAGPEQKSKELGRHRYNRRTDKLDEFRGGLNAKEKSWDGIGGAVVCSPYFFFHQLVLATLFFVPLKVE